MHSESVLVLGGRGFIGRVLVRRLAAQGCRVRVLTRGTPPQREGIEYVRGDLSDPVSLMAAVRGCSAVYHLATGGGEGWSAFQRDFLEGGKAVAEACLREGVRRLIYTSSSAALYLGGTRSVSERDGTDGQPDKRAHYARAKILAERMLMEFHARQNLPVVVLRPAVVMGPGGLLTHSGLGYWPSDLWCLGWGRGAHPLPFVLVDDVAEAMALAREAPGVEGKAYNLAGGVCLSAREFVAEIERRALRRFRFYPQSLWKMQAVELFKWLIKAAARKQDNPLPSYRDLKSRTLRAPLDCSAAESDLGWKPNRDRERFLREAIDAHLDPVPPGDLRLGL